MSSLVSVSRMYVSKLTYTPTNSPEMREIITLVYIELEAEIPEINDKIKVISQ